MGWFCCGLRVVLVGSWVSWRDLGGAWGGLGGALGSLGGSGGSGGGQRGLWEPLGAPWGPRGSLGVWGLTLAPEGPPRSPLGNNCFVTLGAENDIFTDVS